MATLRNKRKLAAVTREIDEEHPRNGQSRNTSVPTINKEYITKVSKEIEGRVTKKLSQEFSRTESHILGALSKLDEFLLNQQIRTHSGTVPETFRNINVDNQGTNEDDSQSDPHPEAGLFRSQTTQNSGPEVGPYIHFNGNLTPSRISGLNISLTWFSGWNISLNIKYVFQDYKATVFLRQMWIDPRLKFHEFNSSIALSPSFLHKLWVPDTYVINEKEANFHMITTENKLLRLSPAGEILYSAR